MKLVYLPGATPLDRNETQGLIPNYITTQAELNELEAKNIEAAIQWLRKGKKKEILNISFIMKLHKKMFGEVWKWAGQQRTSDKNIGVIHPQIMTKLAILLKDAEHWIENKTYVWDEIAVRFHHRLVKIHIFPNGNGRHARLMTDLFLESNGKEPFSWGGKKKVEPIDVEGAVRNEYVDALKAADSGSIILLLEFVRR